jgi:hypothetical protein
MLLLRNHLPLSLLLVVASTAAAFVIVVKPNDAACRRITPLLAMCQESIDSHQREQQDATTSSRRAFLVASGFAGMTLISSTESVEAIGPIKIDLDNPKYSAKPCPKVRRSNHVVSLVLASTNTCADGLTD